MSVEMKIILKYFFHLAFFKKINKNEDIKIHVKGFIKKNKALDKIKNIFLKIQIKKNPDFHQDYKFNKIYRIFIFDENNFFFL